MPLKALSRMKLQFFTSDSFCGLSKYAGRFGKTKSITGGVIAKTVQKILLNVDPTMCGEIRFQAIGYSVNVETM